MKGFLVYLFGALGLGSLLNGAAQLTIPNLGGLRGIAVAAVSIVIWLPIHRWLTHREPAPIGLIPHHEPLTPEQAAEFRERWLRAQSPCTCATTCLRHHPRSGL